MVTGDGYDYGSVTVANPVRGEGCDSITLRFALYNKEGGIREIKIFLTFSC